PTHQFTNSPIHELTNSEASLLRVLHRTFRSDLRAIDVAGGIDRDAFCGAGAGEVVGGTAARFGIRNERDDLAVLAVLDVAHPDAALPAVVVLRHGFGFGVGDVDGVLLVDVDAARPAVLRPLLDERAVLIEDLDAVVVAIADEQAAARVERQ